MFRRVMAWVLIAAFILLLINITVIGFQKNLSIGIYAAIVAFYFIVMPKKK